MTKQKKKQLGQILVESGLIKPEILKKVLFERLTSKKRIGELLVDKGICSEEEIAAALSTQLGIQFVDLKTTPIEPDAVEHLSEKLASKHRVIPISVYQRELSVAMIDPTNMDAIEDVRFASGLELNVHIATPSDVEWAIAKHYSLDMSVDEIVKDISSSTCLEVLDETKELPLDLKDLKKQSQAPPIIRMVNHMLSTAVQQKASDIHIEPTREMVIVRYRVDGHLRKEMELPKWVQGAVLSRTKLMANMDIAEKRVPQDGRFGVRIGGSRLDLRASTLPTTYGEKMVIRVLDQEGTAIGMDGLGMDEHDLRKFKSLIRHPQGIILVTGPTGSGKTTTLYAALREIHSVEKNITTIEDPVEYELDGVNQVGIKEKAGRTFPVVLTSILRQDPDVVMVGEMRDAETATIAMQAALTGHLVLSTLHTNSTIESITRLRNLGIPSYLVASTITGIIAQRLVRRICPDCKVEEAPKPDQIDRLGLTEELVRSMRFYRGDGCGRCGQTGYVGRTAIYETLVLSQRLKKSIANEETEAVIRQLAVAEGTRLLIGSGMEKLRAGETTIDEVLRVVQMEQDFGTLCSKCSHVISPDFVACPGCGEKLIHLCAGCCNVVDPEWSYCPYCAKETEESVAGKREPTGAGVS